MRVIKRYLYGDFVPSKVGNNVTNVSAVNCTFHRPVRKDTKLVHQIIQPKTINLQGHGLHLD